MKMKYGIILGTRPEIIKLYPIIKHLENNNKEYFIIHTNQHYSENMDKIFFKELNLQPAKYNLNVGSHSHAKQTGLMLERLEEKHISENPDIVFIQGDTNTALAGALVASKLKIKIAHVEAGLRSYDNNMPEEINRIIADHISNYLFVPTKKQEQILLSEGISQDKIFVVGNTIVDTLMAIESISEQNSRILEKLSLNPKEYFLATIHRQENVDNKERFVSIFKGLSNVHEHSNKKIIYPIHPRALKMIRQHEITIPEGIELIDPVGYVDMIKLMKNCLCVLTDSGGIQEESCILRVPCVTLRDNTERPETLEVKSNILAGADPEKILQSVQYMIQSDRNWKNPFGEGDSGPKIIDMIENIWRVG